MALGRVHDHCLGGMSHLSRNSLLRNQGCRHVNKPDVAPLLQAGGEARHSETRVIGERSRAQIERYGTRAAV